MTPALPDPSAVLEWPHWSHKSHLVRRLLAAQVVWTLKLDGPLEGRDAMVQLADRLRSRGVELGDLGDTALTALAATLAHQATSTSKGVLTDVPLLRRKVHGRRTIMLSVLTRAPLPPNPFPPEPEPKPELVEPEPTAPTPLRRFEPVPNELAEEQVAGYHDTPRTITVRTLEDKAMLVLRLAGEVALGIAALPPAGEVDDGERLAEAIAESERLRQTVRDETGRRREIEEQLASQKRVNGALKAQAEILQNNLDAHMRYERRPNESGRRALDRMMREPAVAARR